MRKFQIPVIVTVHVTVDGDTTTVDDVYSECEGGPWAYSSYPTAYETEDDDGDVLEWHKDSRDDDVVAAWNAAYDGILMSIRP